MWSRALYLWAGDLNLTCHPTLDNETPKPAPTPEVVKALTRLNRVMGGAVDVYRTLHPKGRAYTHGTVEKGLIKPGSRRRLDAWWAQPTALKGPTGVVSARLVHKERAGFSYTHAHTRKERFKESDHDAVQIVLRGALIPKPQPARVRSVPHPSGARRAGGKGTPPQPSHGLPGFVKINQSCVDTPACSRP